MTEIGLRQLRQNASEFVRRAEAGESIVISVSGRAAARLVPVEDRRWRTYDQIADVFRGPRRRAWAEEVRAWRQDDVDEPRDPFEHAATHRP
ncbi:MAG: type II toxin-antitoxin system Phd/YefM family antitoxin [Kineosporiaceae bacterium]